MLRHLCIAIIAKGRSATKIWILIVKLGPNGERLQDVLSWLNWLNEEPIHMCFRALKCVAIHYVKQSMSNKWVTCTSMHKKINRCSLHLFTEQCNAQEVVCCDVLQPTSVLEVPWGAFHEEWHCSTETHMSLISYCSSACTFHRWLTHFSSMS